MWGIQGGAHLAPPPPPLKLEKYDFSHKIPQKCSCLPLLGANFLSAPAPLT